MARYVELSPLDERILEAQIQQEVEGFNATVEFFPFKNLRIWIVPGSPTVIAVIFIEEYNFSILYM